jgi:UDP-N-acetylmuramoylalanine--D-glutamate ligase
LADQLAGSADRYCFGVCLIFIEPERDRLVIAVFSEQLKKERWKDRRVLVVGAARQGLSLVKYLVKHGADVVLNDARPSNEFVDLESELMISTQNSSGTLSFVFGSHPLELLDRIDLVCVSGGVPLDIPLITEAERQGISLSNDSQMFLEAAPSQTIGITGSAGKTTTTTLVGRIAVESNKYRQVWIGGNIGSPLLSNLDEMGANDLAVMELSSFQLEIMDRSPTVAAVLNITPNHLDRHRTMQAYTNAKRHILEYQSSDEVAILNRDDPGSWALARDVRGKLVSFGLSELPDDQSGTYIAHDHLYFRWADQPSILLMHKSDISLRGQHNLQNILAAGAIATASGMNPEAVRGGVKDFRGVSHRLEFVRRWGGADWFNDSIATAPERVLAAIDSFNEPIILLAGGRDKNLPWDDFARQVEQRVDHLVVFGEAADKILAAIHDATANSSNQLEGRIRKTPLTIFKCSTMAEAVQEAAKIVEPGDVVLLSPGGTSFDEFHDFEERGECFVKLVSELP